MKAGRDQLNWGVREPSSIRGKRHYRGKVESLLRWHKPASVKRKLRGTFFACQNCNLELPDKQRELAPPLLFIYWFLWVSPEIFVVTHNESTVIRVMAPLY
jgi:hypothetical protein